MTQNRITRCKRGFTLIEILIVVVILGILAAIVIPRFAQATDDAESAAAHSQLNVLRGQVRLYWAQHGSTDALGNSVGSVIQALTDEGMLASVLRDADSTTSGFQVVGGYMLTWDTVSGELGALQPNGSASGW